jgi:membrane protein DedA with SNARE-associated domain
MTAQHALDLIVQYENWAFPFAFLVAFAESFAFVSLIVPGSAILALAGALVPSGRLDLWPLLLGAVLGGVLGDATSYWIGWYYGARVRRFWPFSRYPALLARGLAFADRHGGKSIFIGRFFGPVRAIIPLAAGMMIVPPLRFWAANIGSAVLWAPVVIAPGALGGIGLGRLFEAGLSGQDWLTLGAIVVAAIAAGFLGICAIRRQRQHRRQAAATAAQRSAPDAITASPEIRP